MKAFVNAEVCVGCGLCPSVCPEVFKMEGEKAVSYQSPVPEGSEENCRSAAEQCPVSAITLEE